jgi:hypothetical protein
MTAYLVNSIGAMTVTSGYLLRDLYWEAMQSVPTESIGNADKARGMADFLRRVFGTARRQRRWHLLSLWAPRVFSASPYGRFFTCLLVLESIMRVICAWVIERLRSPWRRATSRALYHH